MDDTQRRYRIKNFSFDKCKRGNQGFKQLCLQLFGYLGHGKSSFINTCKYVWDNTAFKNYTNAAGTDEGRTMVRLTYPLTENITLVDNRGCAKMNSFETGEIFAQLGNLLPLDKLVEWSRGFGLADKIVEAEVYVKPSDFIIPIFVYSVSQSIAPGDLDELKELLHTARNLTGVFPIVVLTRKNQGHLTDIEKAFRDIGTEHFFSLESYTPENHVKTRETDEYVIKFLYEVIKDAEFRMEHQRDPEQEMIDRKLFVLNYIHNRDMNNHKSNLERLSKLEDARLQQEMKLKQEEAEKLEQREKEEHEEKMKRLREEFERQRLRDQQEHIKRLKERAKTSNKKSRKKKRKNSGE